MAARVSLARSEDIRDRGLMGPFPVCYLREQNNSGRAIYRLAAGSTFSRSLLAFRAQVVYPHGIHKLPNPSLSRGIISLRDNCAVRYPFTAQALRFAAQYVMPDGEMIVFLLV